MTRRRQWSQHHPRPPQGQRHHARKRLPTTPPLHNNRHSNDLRAPRRHRPADRSNDGAHAAALRMFRSIANHLFLSHGIHAMEPNERESHLCSPASITAPKDRQHTDGNCRKLQTGTADTYPHEGAHRTQKKTLRCILAFLHKPMMHNRQAQKRFPLITKKRASSWKHACTRPAFRYAPRSRHPPDTARSGRGTAPP